VKLVTLPPITLEQVGSTQTQPRRDGVSGDTVSFVVSYDKWLRDITPKHDISDLPNLGGRREWRWTGSAANPT
jgi:hypothetical protein